MSLPEHYVDKAEEHLRVAMYSFVVNTTPDIATADRENAEV